MLSIDEVPICELDDWDSNVTVPFRLHVNEFEGKEAEDGRIWGVDIYPFEDSKRRYFVVKSVICSTILETSDLHKQQPRAYLFGHGRIVKCEQIIRIYV